jgi:hypothetical protein
MPNAAFLLVGKGAHVPFVAGGVCLAQLIEKLAQGRLDPAERCP